MFNTKWSLTLHLKSMINQRWKTLFKDIAYLTQHTTTLQQMGNEHAVDTDWLVALFCFSNELMCAHIAVHHFGQITEMILWRKWKHLL